jgi:homoserine kinase
VLPEKYLRSDVVFNLSRLASLTHALTAKTLNAKIIGESMQDRIHQPYRKELVPGLSDILQLNSQDLNGLLGVCLSGAGPCILALSEHSFDNIGKEIMGIFSRNNVKGVPITSSYVVLDFDRKGLVVNRS